VDVKKIDNKFLSFMVGRMGYADAVIAKLIVKKGGQLLEPTAGFIVKNPRVRWKRANWNARWNG
jgi:hypothetical protein